jgi:hypothetical protein
MCARALHGKRDIYFTKYNSVNGKNIWWVALVASAQMWHKTMIYTQNRISCNKNIWLHTAQCLRYIWYIGHFIIWIWCSHQVSHIFILLYLANYIKQTYIPRNRDLLQLRPNIACWSTALQVMWQPTLWNLSLNYLARSMEHSAAS